MAKTTAKRLTVADENGAVEDAQDAQDEKRFKNFGVPVRIAEMVPLEFELCGHTFHCRPAIQSKKMISFVRKTDSDSGAAAGEALHEFMETAIIPEDVEAWREIVDGEEYLIDAAQLGDIVSWLVEQYSERPTKR